MWSTVLIAGYGCGKWVSAIYCTHWKKSLGYMWSVLSWLNVSFWTHVLQISAQVGWNLLRNLIWVTSFITFSENKASGFARLQHETKWNSMVAILSCLHLSGPCGSASGAGASGAGSAGCGAGAGAGANGTRDQPHGQLQSCKGKLQLHRQFS